MPILASRAGFMSGKFAAGKAPDAPTGVTSARLNLSLNISGTAPDFNGGLAITDYEYALSTNSGSTYGSWISSGSSSFPFLISNLTNGQAYYVKIRGVNALGGGNEFGPITTGTTPSTVPSAPTNVSGTNYADSQSVVTWTAPADNGAVITGYKVEYAASPYSSWTTFNADTGTTATSITVTSLNNGTYYKFRISAINVAGTGSTGTSVSAFLPAVIPGVPTNPSINSGSNSITISWSAPVSDGGAPPVSYTVETQRESDAWVDRGTQTSPYAITGLLNGSTYRARITANTIVGPSATKAITGDAVPSTIPDAPTNISGTSNASFQSVVTWTAPANNGAVITGYKVEYAPSPLYSAWTVFNADTGNSATSLTVTGLGNGTTYKFRVSAKNLNGFGSTNISTGTVTPATTPDAPVLLSLTRGYRRLTAAFSAPAYNGGNAINDYEYSVNNGSTWASMGQFTTSDFAIINLADYTSYDVRVRAVNGAGGGTQSNLLSAYTAGIPGTVTGIGGTSNANTQSTVSWTAPDANGTAITDYIIEYSTSSTFASGGTVFADGTSSAVSTTVTGLSNGTTYYFRVKAVNAVGQSLSWSSISSGVVPATAPNTPVVGTSSTSDRSVTINWTASTSNGGAAITYTVELWDSVQGWYTSSTTTDLSKQFTARNDRGYIARVYASNSAGSSGYSGNSTQVYPAMVVPTMYWVDSSATKYSDWSMSWSGTSGYTYQPQKYYTSWADFGGSQSGSGAKTSDTFTVGYTATVYGRVKVTDPDGVVSYTNQRYVTAGRAAGNDPDTYSWNAATYTTSSVSGTIIASSQDTVDYANFNGSNPGLYYPISYPHVFDDNTAGVLNSTDRNIVYVTGVRITMTRNNSTTFDLTGTTQTNTTGRKVFFYGPGGIAMRLYGGTTLGQDWGTPDQTSTTKWTGTISQNHTWSVDSTVSGQVLVNGVRCLQAPGNGWYLSGGNTANTVYSTNWGAATTSAATAVQLTVYYMRERQTTLTTSHPYDATNSTYG